VPDPFLGHRLVAKARDPETVRSALEEAGINPIVSMAFEEAKAVSTDDDAGISSPSWATSPIKKAMAAGT
jgi:hypothetical protein